MKIIVTGGAGFIGGNFVHYMLKKHPEDEIICLDALTYAGNMETLAPVMDNPKFKFVKGDITDRKMVFELFETEKPDVVVNFAAESHVDRSIENPSVFLETNIMGTQVLMDACRKYGIQRYHQVSTDEVYGDLPLEVQTQFFQLLDCQRQIGLTLNDSLLMTPSKSVTAVFGIGACVNNEKEHKCDTCKKTNCQYRKAEIL